MHHFNIENFHLSHHVRVRMQQRGITGDILETILNFGKRSHSGGAYSYALDKHGRERARKELGEPAFRRIADRLDCYVVVSFDGAILTAAHRIRRKIA